ncbi:sporulation protein [Kitasatospora atroaurantiaca]|uniref:Sporulation-control protein n=1 Tax=Kitasatospora atroaurantiaca TaxID=285545 RepID=A0A561ET25_9ACTN|nr:sporulation protein [Kitasatospora atroaurantiaca]TWE18770.1 sporulation-control protein [Kitasatospora atroaurantiaca]
MVFKKLLGALGVGGPAVDTVLSTPVVQPGGLIQGQVNLTGGSQEADISGITLTLVARVEIEHEEGESDGLSAFARYAVTAPLRLAPGEQRSIPFSVPAPYETPVTAVAGRNLSGMALGVRTEVEISGARDKGDADPLGVEPLPVQRRVLEAFAALGFRFRSADLEAGHIRGTGQSLPFYQEIEFAAAPQYAHQLGSVELTFLASASRVEVVLELDRHGGDTVNTHVLDHAAAEQDLTAVVDGWLQEAIAHRSSKHASGHGVSHGGGRGGFGGAVAAGVAGAAVGFVGGMVVEEFMDEVVEEVFEDAFEDVFDD